MSTEQNFDTIVNGIEYRVETYTQGSNDTFRVTTNNGALTVTDAFGGKCYPLRSLWSDWRYQCAHGAAQAAMEKKCIKNAVAREVETHMELCLQLVEDDLKAEENEAHERAVTQRQREIKKAEADAWNRKVQADAARQNAQAAHEVSKHLSVADKKIVFMGQQFGWERTEGGGIRVDRALNDAARKSGLQGQAVGELYSLAQKMVSGM